MRADDFEVKIVRRSVEVRCPDKNDGTHGVLLPPGYDDDEWMDDAVARFDGLVGVEGPTVQGAYVFHWEGTETDGQIRYRSLRTIRERY